MKSITILQTEYESIKAENVELKQQVNWLMEQLKLSKHRQFGASSEKSEYDQLSLFNEAEASAKPSAKEPELKEVKAYHRKKSRTFFHGRRCRTGCLGPQTTG